MKLRAAQLVWIVWLAMLPVGGGAHAQAARTIAVRVRFEHSFAGAPLRFDDVACRTDAGNTLSVSRLSYLVSNFRLIASDAKPVTVTTRAGFINAVEGRDTIKLGAVPAGTYTGLEFDIGLPPELNHADPASFAPDDPLNPLVNQQHWGWQGGFVFLAIEGRWVQADDSLGGYSFHVANDEHRMHVVLTFGAQLGTDTELVVNMDAAKVFGGVHRIVIDAREESQSTHSRPEDVLAGDLAANIAQAFELVDAKEASEAGGVVADLAVPIPAGTTALALKLPKHFPQVKLPSDNPLTVEGVALGKRLFYDARLSAGDAQSCAGCHAPGAAYSDRGNALSKGVDGKEGSRNAMPLFNLAWSQPAGDGSGGFTWDGRRARIRDQVLAPIQDAREMHQSLDAAVGKLKTDPEYPGQFARAFGSPGITPERLGLAVEQYLLTLISADAKFDRALDGRETLSAEEKRGQSLFVTEYDPKRGQFGADCFHCHGSNLFTDHRFRSNGLDLDSTDPGRQGVSRRDADHGRFKTPSLRNVEASGPYMHDGRFKTLEEVLEHYSRHVLPAPSLDPNLAKHLVKSPDGRSVAGVRLSPEDRAAMIAFLKTLTDKEFLEGKSSEK